MLESGAELFGMKFWGRLKMLEGRYVIGVGAKSSIKPDDLRAALGVWFLPPEFEVVSMPVQEPARAMCRTLSARHPDKTCIALQGGKVALVESGSQVARDGEWAYVYHPEYGEYQQFVMPDPLYVYQQHLKHVHHTQVDNELVQQRPPAQVLLAILLEESGAVPPNLRPI